MNQSAINAKMQIFPSDYTGWMQSKTRDIFCDQFVVSVFLGCTDAPKT